MLSAMNQFFTEPKTQTTESHTPSKRNKDNILHLKSTANFQHISNTHPNNLQIHILFNNICAIDMEMQMFTSAM